MLLMWSDTGIAGNQGQRGVQWLQGCKWAAITVVVVASPMLGKVSQVTASRSAQSAQSAHAQTAITVVVVASPMLGKVSQVTASGSAQSAHAQTAAGAQRCIKSHATLSQGICSCCRARGGVLMPWQQGSRPDWGSETGRHADMQVSMERTIGTVCGGLLGLGISLLGHGFGQDSDMVFTGDTLPALLHGVRATQ